MVYRLSKAISRKRKQIASTTERLNREQAKLNTLKLELKKLEQNELINMYQSEVLSLDQAFNLVSQKKTINGPEVVTEGEKERENEKVSKKIIN